MKMLSFLTLAGLLSISACSHFSGKSCCKEKCSKEKQACSKEIEKCDKKDSESCPLKQKKEEVKKS